MFSIFTTALYLAHTSLVTSSVVLRGSKSYTSYYVGDSPIIILSQHGGNSTDVPIPDRQTGCYNTSSDECIFTHDCNETMYKRNESECAVKTLKDSYTREIAVCLAKTIDLFGDQRANHLVINELHRIKLDANREIGEATFYQNESIIAWNEIHFDFMERAKNTSVNECGFGLVFDIHGQAVNQFNQLAYRVSNSKLESSDSVIDSSSSSIAALVENNIQNASLSEIIKGAFSLGTIMNETYGYTIVPSTVQPFLDDSCCQNPYYYMGGFGLEQHGSKYGGNVDAIQIEVNRDNRWNSTLRAQFCIDFSRAIEQFVTHFYDLSQCSSPSINPTANPSSHPMIVPTSNPTIAPTSNPITEPTADPTAQPITPSPSMSSGNTSSPTSVPTIVPTSNPTTQPIADPTMQPTTPSPSLNSGNSSSPTFVPTTIPTTADEVIVITEMNEETTEFDVDDNVDGNDQLRMDVIVGVLIAVLLWPGLI